MLVGLPVVALPKGWEWGRGMLTMSGYRLIGYDNGGWQAGTDRDPESRPVDLDRMQGERPDLTDPATLGAIRGLVEELHGDPIHFHFDDISERWEFWVHKTIPGHPRGWKARHFATAPTYAEALIVGLEAAP